MNLDIHMIPARPTVGDPLAEQAYAALVWKPDNELIEVPANLDSREAAAHVALTIAAEVMRKMVPILQAQDIATSIVALIARVQADAQAKQDRRRG